MHVSDINDAIERGATTDLEAAFRALVRCPGEDAVRGLASPGKAMTLLRDVASALFDDDRLMPGDLADFIRDETDGALEATTYAAGSWAVRMHSMRWRDLLKAALARRGEG